MNQAHRSRLLGVLLCLLTGALGCAGASDGGPIGTGIVQASIVGNVIDVTDLASLDGASRVEVAAPLQDATLPPVEISVDGRPDATARTDANGTFELVGDVAGDITLRFTTEDFSVTTALSVPVASIVSLVDIELSPAGVEVQSVRQLDFVAIVREADCASGLLQVDDLSGEAFEIDVQPATVFEDDDGTASTCTAIDADERIAIDGVVAPGAPGRVVASRIVIGPAPNAPLEGPRSLVFVGFAVALICNQDGTMGRLAIEDEIGRTSLRIARDTSITRPDGTEISCPDIRIGDQVGGLGTWSVREPGEIRADRLLVSHRPNPDVQLRFVGYITKVDCSTGAIELFFQGTRTDVVLLPITVIRPPAFRSCEDLSLGDRLSGVGRLAADGSDAIEITRVQVQKRE
jgi:hypothetical protein